MKSPETQSRNSVQRVVSWRRRKGKLTMVCLRCDGEGDDFETKVQTFEQLFKGETIMVTGETQTCKKCGWFTLTLDQMNTIYQQTKREYAKRKPANDGTQRGRDAEATMQLRREPALR